MIAERIKEQRKKLGMTCTVIAEHLGISHQAYLAFEHGDRVPSVPVAKNLAKIFDCTLNYLLAND